MTFTNYNIIKERITDYVTRINNLKYKDYEKDLAYLKGLCNYYRRTVGEQAARYILGKLDEFDKKLRVHEFYETLKTDHFYIKVMGIMKNVGNKEFHNKEQDLGYLKDLLNEYTVFMWEHYGNDEIDADMIMTLQRFNTRLANVGKIIFSDLKASKVTLTRR